MPALVAEDSHADLYGRSGGIASSAPSFIPVPLVDMAPISTPLAGPQAPLLGAAALDCPVHVATATQTVSFTTGTGRAWLFDAPRLPKDTVPGTTVVVPPVVPPAPANNAPQAFAGSATLNEDTSTNSWVWAMDADGDSLTYSLNTGPSHGAATVNANGSWSYTPTANYHGADSFTYAVNDGHGGTATQTVSLTINSVPDTPVGTNAAVHTYVGTPISGTASITSPETGLTFTKPVNPSHGSVTLNADGSWTYTPTAGYTGTDTFTLRGADPTWNWLTANSQVTVTIDGTTGEVKPTSNGWASYNPAGGMAVTSDGAGGFYLAWGDNGDRIYTEHVNADGSVAYASTIAATGVNLNAGPVSVAHLTNGNAVVSWETFGGAPQTHYMIVNGADGTAAVTDTAEPTLAGTNYTGTSHVAALSTGGFVTVFTDTYSSGGFAYTDLAMVVHANDGTVLSGPTPLVANTSSGKWADGTMGSNPFVTALDGGQFFVGWTIGTDGAGTGAMGRVFNSDGSAATGEILLNSAPAGGQQFRAATALDGGGFAVAYSTDINGYVQPVVRLFDAAGNPTSGDISLSVGTNNSHARNITQLSNGNLAVVWDTYSAASDWDVYVQEVTTAGAVVGSPFRVNTTTSGEQSGASVVAMQDGQYVVFWDNMGTPGVRSPTYRILPAELLGPQTLSGTAGNDSYLGSDKADTISGAAGNDHIQGQGGADLLTGGTGADQFIYAASDLGTTDTISDFNASEGDKLDLSAFLAGNLDLNHVRLTGAADNAVTLQARANTGDPWQNLATLQNAVDGTGTLNGNGAADAVTQAQLDAVVSNWINNHTIQ